MLLRAYDEDGKLTLVNHLGIDQAKHEQDHSKAGCDRIKDDDRLTMVITHDYDYAHRVRRILEADFTPRYNADPDQFI